MLVVVAAPALDAGAETYPARPVRFIVPYAAGGSSDIIARLHGQRLGETLGQTFVVDNRPGAGGVIGTEILARSPPDGYTLILQDMPHTINPAVYGKVPYDPLKDFTAITLVARAPQWLFVHPAVAAKTARELIALAKSQPGELRIGSAGNGSGTHLMAELLMRGGGIQLTHVPYKGAGPAVTAGPAPLYGAWVSWMPPPRMNSSAIRCVPLPFPAEPILTLPGWDFASAISSRADFAGTDGFTNSHCGARATSVSVVKSLTGSYGTLP